jgi:hypothetical protein
MSLIDDRIIDTIITRSKNPLTSRYLHFQLVVGDVFIDGQVLIVT